MIFSFLLAAQLSCPTTRFELTGVQALGLQDKQALEQAQKRCPILYPNSPCVRVFRRTAPQTYQVICGPRKSS